MRRAVACLALFLAAAAVACDGEIQTVEIERPEGIETTSGATEPRATGPVVRATRGPADEELANRAARFSGAEFKAAYAMTVESDEIQFDGILSWYRQPGMVRGDFSGQAGEQKVDIVVIPGPGYPNEEFLYVCHRASKSCIESRAESEQDAYPNGEFPVALASVLLAAEEFAEAAVITKTLERTIAGQEVMCFSGSGVDGAPFDTGEVCVTRDGVVLSVTQEASDRTTSLVATVFSNEVDDDNFTLPYALIEGG